MSRLGWFGVLTTLVYIGIFCWLFGAQISEIRTLEPNELGDFFAGVFGPVALFWVVLGFFQQGVELRHSVETLKLQAEELKNSVEQQRELVKASRDQIEFDREINLAQRARHEVSIRPDFKVSPAGSSQSGKEISFKIEILNRGEIALDVWVFIEPPTYSGSKFRFQSIGRGEYKHVGVHFFENMNKGGDFLMTIKYSNKEGSEFSDEVNLTLAKKRSDGPFSELKVINSPPAQP
ncbi:hypothetical protein [Hoeflea sp. EC-HK425]|uniref:hypothetical protein n=1 Tax=Hoeflea sp. EC-HK425 TaxID=2038388 RepID=UPI00125A5463|nr:hypothetical protein [Hoeflea sp. EC-HK425]VVT07706.1 conserved hypothetical protein [Hoeflea sp. EC-HK425]